MSLFVLVSPEAVTQGVVRPESDWVGDQVGQRPSGGINDLGGRRNYCSRPPALSEPAAEVPLPLVGPAEARRAAPASAAPAGST